MQKQVILITGTPCVGKTTTSKLLTEKLSAEYINLTEYAKKHNLILGEDKERKTTIIDEKAMHKKIRETIKKTNNSTIIIDGHYAAVVTPRDLTTHVFVLRKNPKELKKQMQKSDFNEAKIYENLSAEILDSCLIEAIQNQNEVCEIDTTGKIVDEVVAEITSILDGNKKGLKGYIDWLGLLEQEGITNQYLKE